MKTHHITKSIFFLVTVLLLGVFACSDDSEYYKTFVEGGEITYTGKIDSLQIFPGKNRIKVQGLITSDPKVTELRIYWNLRQDSTVVPINRTSGVDTVSVVINDLEENIYNFEFLTFDSKGNQSISQFRTAEVYGNRYANSLLNRPILNYVLSGDMLTINFASMDLSTGVFGSELEYTSSSEVQKTTFISIENPDVVIPDFKFRSSFTYRTAFLPEEMAIDTFYTAFDTIKPLGAPVLGNASVPFLPANSAGRWGTLADPWKTNEAMKNHNGYGGWDAGCCERPDSTLNAESGWGSPEITNGKIYQTVIADPATYQLTVKVYETNFSAGDDQGIAYLVVATGDGLPDVEDISTSPNVLGSKRIISAGSNIIEFTVQDEGTELSIGEVTTQLGNYYCVITSFELVVK